MFCCYFSELKDQRSLIVGDTGLTSSTNIKVGGFKLTGEQPTLVAHSLAAAGQAWSLEARSSAISHMACIAS